MMTTQETAYTEIERLVKNFKELSARVDEEVDKWVRVLYGLLADEINIGEGNK